MQQNRVLLTEIENTNPQSFIPADILRAHYTGYCTGTSI